MRSSFTLFPLVLVVAACNTSKPGASDTMAATGAASAMPADDGASRAAIDSLRSAWKAGSDKKDAAAVAALYADDATLVTTQAPFTSGRANIQAMLGKMFSTGVVGTIDSKDLVVAGNDAYDYGSFKQDVKLPNGKTVSTTGYYVVALRKQSDGGWKILRHVSTTPPAQP